MTRRKIAIEGLSGYGQALAYALAVHHNLYVFDPDKNLGANFAENQMSATVIANGIDAENLDENGPFDVFVAAYNDDSKNLESCLFVKEHYGSDPPLIISLVRGEKTKSLLDSQGIITIDPYKFFIDQVTVAINGELPREEPAEDKPSEE